MSAWKKLLSHLIPIKEAEFKSRYSGILELTWEKGLLVLNTAQTNYSYNHLHAVLKGAMHRAGLQSKSITRVLNLGLGAGSSIKILREEWKKDPYIRSVEIDPTIIQLADSYFGVNEDERHEIILADALAYLEEDKASYDLYIVDLFLDDQVNTEVMYISFLQGLKQQAMPGASILINTMLNERSEGYKKSLDNAGIHYQTYTSKDNEVFIFQGFN